MGGSWTFFLLLAVAAAPVWPLEYNITTTWNGEDIDHPPIQVTLAGSIDTQYLELSIVAPFFNDPPAPPGPSGQPFYGLWDYEVVEAFFLNDDNQYVEVEVCPWGQHIVLLLNGQRNTIRHSLPMEVTTTRSNDTWTGLARIPVEYLPKNVTKFNAYGIHGSGENRIYESLYPAENGTAPDFHALEYFGDIDLSGILPEQEGADMSEFWVDSLEGIFRYRIQTTWNDLPISHPPAEITLQGFTAGIEMNVTAPFFNDPAPDGEAGKPFYGLWDYEVVEMFFLNDNDEYLEVELSPWGEHLLLLLKGARNVLKHSLTLDYIIVERTNATQGELGQWSGSAMIPPGYFPPNVTRMNAYAIHGTNDSREYQSLYPAPNDDPDYLVPDFHRLELFRPIDFEFQVTNNTEYSQVWQDAEDSGSAALTPAVETEEVVEVVTVLGPAEALLQPTHAPVQTSALEDSRQTVVLDNEAVLLRKPKPQLVLPNEPREQRLEEEVGVFKPTFGGNEVPKPQPVRIGNREFDDNLQSQDQIRPLTQPQSGTLEFHNQGQPRPPFQDDRRVPGNSQFQNQRPHNQGQLQGSPAVHGEDLPQETSQFSNQGQSPFQTQGQTQDQFNNQNVRQPQRPSLFQSQEDPQLQNQGQPQFQNQGQPQLQSQGQPQFQNQGPPQFHNQGQSQFQSQGQPQFQNPGQPQFQNQRRPQFQNQGRPQSQNQGHPQFQNQGRPQSQNQGRPQFQNQGHPQSQNQGHPQFQNQGHPQSQNQGRPQFQSQGQTQFQEETQPQFHRPNNVVLPAQGPPRFQEQGRPPIQFQESSQFEDPGLPTQAPHIQIQNQRFQQESSYVDIAGSETSVGNPSLDVGLQDNITPEVEQAVITLAEGTPALPPPHPVCFELGLVPDPDRCYVFHECVLDDGEWQMYSWRCRRGQVFDPVNVACVRGRCARTPTRRRRVKTF